MSKGVALVTGSAQGIGREIALRLADDGFDVAINDISSQKGLIDEVVEEVKGKGRHSLAVVANVSVEEDVKAMVASVVEKLGGLDVVIIISLKCVPSPQLIALSTLDGGECWNRSV